MRARAYTRTRRTHIRARQYMVYEIVLQYSRLFVACKQFQCVVFFFDSFLSKQQQQQQELLAPMMTTTATTTTTTTTSDTVRIREKHTYTHIPREHMKNIGNRYGYMVFFSSSLCLVGLSLLVLFRIFFLLFFRYSKWVYVERERDGARPPRT